MKIHATTEKKEEKYATMTYWMANIQYFNPKLRNRNEERRKERIGPVHTLREVPEGDILAQRDGRSTESDNRARVATPEKQIKLANNNNDNNNTVLILIIMQAIQSTSRALQYLPLIG
jgi:hypothetical protein